MKSRTYRVARGEREVTPPVVAPRTRSAVAIRAIRRTWRPALMISALVGLDLVLTLPIMGATRRPFSWSGVDAYPVIQDVTMVNGKATLSVMVSPGHDVTLERNTNLLNTTAWRDAATTTATEQVIHLMDTNPLSGREFYRVRQGAL